MFVGHQAEEGHEFARMIEAAQVTEFADDGHGGNLLEALACHQGFHDRLPFPVGQKLLHSIGEAFDAFVAGVDGLDVFLEHDLLNGTGQGEFAQVAHVGGSPSGLAGVADAVAQQE